MKELQLDCLAENFVFLEGPRWHEGKLWFSDMWGHTIYAMSPDGQYSAIAEVPNRPSGLAFLPDGRLVAVSMGDRKLYVVADGGALEPFADLGEIATADINDCVVDADGNIYVGNFGYDLMAGADPAPASMAMVTPTGNVSVAATDLEFPNGTVITPDGNTMICAETFGNRLTAFDRAADGSLSNRRVWADLGERTPDGICLDNAGGVWVSSFMTDEFVRVVAGGEVTHRAACPGKRAVACNLGGGDGRTLFALTFAGELEDIASGAKLARVETCTVEAGASGSP